MCKSPLAKLATQMNPINHNFTCSCCHIIAKLNGAPLLPSPSSMHEVVCVAAVCEGSKGDASLASGRHNYRVIIQGDRRHDGRAGDHLVYSPYYHSVNTITWQTGAQIKECCVDNAVGLDGQLWCAQQPEMQSKVDVLGAAEAGVQVEHRLNLTRSRETDRENGYENHSPVFSHERCPR